jgi:hypothetical protein
MGNGKYKVVFILGSRLGYIGYDLRNNTLYNKEKFLLIGDGENPITQDDLSVLSNKINKNTAIIICTHGSVRESKHSIHLFESAMHTAYFFKILQDINPKIPLNIFLDTCYAGYAAQDVEAMDIGSTLVAFSDGKVQDNIFRSLKGFITSVLESDLDRHPFNHFLPNLQNYIYDKLTVSYVNSMKILYHINLRKYFESCHIKSSSDKFVDTMQGELEGFSLCIAKAFNAEHYKAYISQASTKLNAEFDGFIARLLIHYVMQDDIANVREVLRYCKSDSNDCDLNAVINIEDEYYMHSLMEHVRYVQSDELESVILGKERSSFETDYELFHSQHKQCSVDYS